jgi:hypothetical protein
MSEINKTTLKADAEPESANELKLPGIDARYLVKVIQAFHSGYCSYGRYPDQDKRAHDIALNNLRYQLPEAVADALTSLAEDARERGWQEIWDNPDLDVSYKSDTRKEKLASETVTKETAK